MGKQVAVTAKDADSGGGKREGEGGRGGSAKGESKGVPDGWRTGRPTQIGAGRANNSETMSSALNMPCVNPGSSRARVFCSTGKVEACPLSPSHHCRGGRGEALLPPPPPIHT